MSTDPVRTPEADLPRARPTGQPTEPDRSLLARLDNYRSFKPALLVGSALSVGLVLAPDWAMRNYPTDPSLVGTPSAGDVKAEYDDRGDIIDEETTARLRDEAVAKVKRVYDYDALLARKTAEQVFEAFAAARQKLAELIESRPGFDKPLGLSKADHAAYSAALEKALAAGRARIEEELGVRLSPGDAQILAADRFDEVAAMVLSRLAASALGQPIVASRDALAQDGDNGITVRRVPDDGSPKRVVMELGTIADVATVRGQVEAMFEDARNQVRTELEQQAEAAGAAEELRRLKRKRGEPLVRPEVRGLVTRLAKQLVRPTLTLNRRDTELARADALLSVAPVKITVKRGEMIVRDGEVMTKRHLLVLGQMAEYSRHSSIVMVSLGAALLVLVLAFVAFTYRGVPGRGFPLKSRDALFLAVLFVLAVVVGRLWLVVAQALHDTYPAVPMHAFLFVLPVAAGAMTARLVLRVEAALVFAVVGSLVIGLMVDGERLITAYALVGSALGATLISTISSRSDVLRAGLWVGVGQAVTALGIYMFASRGSFSEYLIVLPAAFFGGVIGSFIALAITPVVESLFGYTTDLKLLELANLNHPALKELIVQAPGTYHHSIIVGSLVEAAAEEIGANALLAKVMAYYHDLGKGCNALYFIENQRGQNPHDKLKPSMSAMIIRRHVTDGLEMAKRYKLGEQILSGIAEHHGTTLIHYFYAKAREADGEEHVHENDYRYPGRKPQSRETALVMLGDSVEAASRSLADPTPARLKGMVNKIINTKFTDGQLEECDLTLQDLHRIARAFIRILNSIYHQRVEYPELTRPTTKGNGDIDQKPPKRPEDPDDPPAEDRPDNIRRLGLSGR